ncbi:MAG: VanZ family protein, partial [bacterium]
MKKTILYLRLWLPPIAWCAIIYYLSSVPGLNSGLGSWDLILRKCAHITEYAILTVLFFRAFSFHKLKKVYEFSAVISVMYAISDEIHQ